MATLTPNTFFSAAKLVADLISLGGNVDVVGVFDSSSFQQVFEQARPMKARVRESSRVMQHPLENGKQISDFRIILQNQVEIPLIIPSPFYSSTYQQIKSLFLNATLLSVQTKTGVYPNMIIADMPHEEDPAMYDSITLGLHLTEVQFTESTPVYAPVDPQNESTVARGQQQPQLTQGVIIGNTGVASPSASPSSMGAFNSATIGSSLRGTNIEGIDNPTSQPILWGGF